MAGGRSRVYTAGLEDGGNVLIGMILVAPSGGSCCGINRGLVMRVMACGVTNFGVMPTTIA